MEVKMARKNKKQRKHPKFWFGFKIVLLLFLLTILVGGIIFYFKYGKDIFAMQDDAVALVKEYLLLLLRLQKEARKNMN